jgi:hypothetical protein
MLVVSRKKRECLVIDGVIHVEVVGLIQGVARLRLMAPRTIRVKGDAARPASRPADDPGRASGASALELRDVTMAARDVIRLGESVSLGMVDADKTRALLFVDAPPGTRVVAAEPQGRQPESAPASQQSLLQFMDQGDHAKRDQEKTIPLAGSHAASALESADSGPRLLPFVAPPASATGGEGDVAL